VSKETYYSVKRDLYQCQKRPTTVSKETYYSVKRDLLQCQKRPTTVSKETYCSVKRDLLQCQKRPTTESKETFYSVKRDLLQCKTLTYLTTLSSASVLRVSTPEHDSAASSGCNSCNRRCAPDIHSQKSMSKETYYSVKRDLLQCQKRPTTVSRSQKSVP